MNSNDRAILEEFCRRKSKADLLDRSFSHQTNFILDPAKKKAAQCSRRSGKSYGIGLYLFKEAMANPGVTCLYLALTRESAKRIMYKDVLKTINQKFGLHASFNEVTLTVTMPNGSVIYLLGLDQSDRESEKLLGQKYKLVVIDESASYRVDLREIVYAKIYPALADLDGTICMVGSTSNISHGLFFDITNGNEKGWSLHKWGWQENPYMCEKVQKDVNELVAANPSIQDTPLFKQMYLNQWVIDDSKLVYKYSQKNLHNGKPVGNKWTYVLGVDLGYEDDTAFVVAGYQEYDPKLYIFETVKQKHMDITAVANYCKYLMKTYDFDHYVVDGSDKQAVEEMKNRHGIPFVAAEKSGKSDFIEIMNAELIQGHIMLWNEKTYDLQDEWKSLVWDEKSVKRIENASCPNHLADAALYAWRFCYHYMADEQDKNSEEVVDEWWDQEADKLSSEKAKPFWELDI